MYDLKRLTSEFRENQQLLRLYYPIVLLFLYEIYFCPVFLVSKAIMVRVDIGTCACTTI